jgi:hypothetical protein
MCSTAAGLVQTVPLAVSFTAAIMCPARDGAAAIDPHVRPLHQVLLCGRKRA